MSKKNSKRKSTQRKQTILTYVFGLLPFVLSFTLLLIYGFTKNLVLWLAALSSISWLVLAGGYIYALANKWDSVSLKNSVYKMKPVTSKEATFFHCLFAIIFIALGVVLAIVFFREWLLA